MFSNNISGRRVQCYLEDRRDDYRQCFSETFLVVLFLDPVGPVFWKPLLIYNLICKFKICCMRFIISTFIILVYGYAHYLWVFILFYFLN